MAGNTPPPPPPGPPEPTEDGGGASPPAGWPGGATGFGSPAYGPAEMWTGQRATGPGSARRAPLVLVLALVVALMLGGGAFAFFKADPFHLFRPGPQAAEGLPADAVLYGGMDLDPTASQKIDALRFLNHFPAFRSSAGLTDANADVRKVLFGKLVDSLHCPAVDYARDVEPWLGQRFGFALMPPTVTEDHPYAVAVQVGDQGAARKGIALLETCDASGQAPASGPAAGVAFANRYLLLSRTQADADTYAKSATEHSLADDQEFSADIGSLGDAGVATMWVDVKAALSAFGDGSSQLYGLTGSTSSAQRVAATFRFGSDHVEIATSVFGDAPPVEHGDNPIVRLPDSTVFAVSESGGDQRLAQAWDGSIAKTRAQSPELDKAISDFEAQSGLSLPGDLETILGHNIMVALDSEGLTPDVLAGDDPSRINFGARFTNDPTKLDVIYDKLLGLVHSQVDQSVPFVKKDVADGLVIATNESYADKLGALDGTLGDTDAFRSVVDDGAGKEFVLFVNFDAVKDQILQSMGDAGQSARIIDNLRPLKAFGITQDVDGGYLHSTVRLSVDD